VLRLKGQAPPVLGAPPGDVLVEVAVRPHPRFTRKGRDIHLELPISLPEAVLGAKVTVPTIDGPVRLAVPAGANSGAMLRLRGRGVPGKDGERGDQYVRLIVMLPDRPDPELTAFLRRWSEAHGYDVRAEMDAA
jgi:DnaJ-class molecular chaperone